jgi:hypothetical protein
MQEEVEATRRAVALNFPEPVVGITADERNLNALDMALCGGFDGSHHKQWVIDQMIRALTGGPNIGTENDPEYGESTEYLEWVKTFCDGDDGPNTYEWDTGIAP